MCEQKIFFHLQYFPEFSAKNALKYICKIAPCCHSFMKYGNFQFYNVKGNFHVEVPKIL